MIWTANKAAQLCSSRLGLVAGLCFLLSLVNAQAAPTVTATWDRDTIVAGESAVLTIKISGTFSRVTVPKVAPAGTLTVGYDNRPVQQYVDVNGARSQSVDFNFQATTAQTGDFTLPPATLTVDNQPMTVQPPVLHVVAQGVSGSASDPYARYAFIRLIVPKKTIYVGEIVPIQIQLYFQSAEDITLPKLESEGFTFNKVDEPKRSRVQNANTIYNLYTFERTATAIKAGKVKLGPVECPLRLNIPIGRDLFGVRTQQRQTTLLSEAVEMEVLPLPTENQPPDFTGAVGNFSLEVTAKPTTVAVGDPITLTVRISGKGAIERIALPSFESWREFKVYPPTANLELPNPLATEGAKVFEQVVAAQNADVKEIPAVRFHYFDPDQKMYRTLRKEPIPLQVKAGSEAAVQPTVVAKTAADAQRPVSQDIVHIKPHLGSLTSLSGPVIRNPLFWLFNSLPMIAWACVAFWRWQTDQLANNPRLRRRMEVGDVVAAGLAQLPSFAGANDHENFFATVFRLLQEQLGERLDLPASAITEAVVDDRLSPAGVPEELITQLHELFQTCNAARYAPQGGSKEMNSLVPKVQSVLKQLQSWDFGV